ncbi:hypothetical protein [Streptomyces sp. NPDC090445]|uniref:hypothetical protein n=1 Tax=Streptomyces sp. NPDC090445 TaxID=3365963 RepID=UPI0038134053
MTDVHTMEPRHPSIAVRVSDQHAESAALDAHSAGTCDCALMRGAVDDPRRLLPC